MTQIRVLSVTETIITVVWPFGKTECSRHRTTKFPNSESPIFTMKFLFWFFYWFWEYILRLFWDLERIRKGCEIAIYKLQNVLPYCLIKQVNKIIGIRNSKIWLFNDVSKIKIRKMNTIFNQNITFFSILSKNSFAKRSYYINYFLCLTQDSNLSQKSQSIL